MHHSNSPEKTTTAVQPAYRSALVIDDESFSQALLRKRLEQLSIGNVAVADNGFSALRLIDSQAQDPDLVICDLFMPEMDGIELLAELAKRDYRGGLILVTGVNLNTLMLAYELAVLKNLKVLGSFTKPVPLEALSQALGISLD